MIGLATGMLVGVAVLAAFAIVAINGLLICVLGAAIAADVASDRGERCL